MRLTYEKGKQDKIHISIDGEYKMTVDAVFWYGLGIRNNSEIDSDGLADITDKVNTRRAYNKGLDLISRREHSRTEIIRKLNQKGYQSVSEKVADDLCEKGYIDDERFAVLYSQQLKQRKEYGKRRIAQQLYLKGIDKSIIDTVLDGIEDDASEEIARLIEKKYYRYLSDEKGITKTVNALLRLGYGIRDIKNALKEFDKECEKSYDE